jgi:hypothetical protein
VTYTVVLTTDWGKEDIAKHAGQLTHCMIRYVDEFPEFETLENMFAEIESGVRQLWAIMRDGDVKCIVVTEIEKINATGKVVCRYAAMGGVEGVDAVPAMIEAIEPWAIQEHGADFCEVFGRRGWGRLFKNHHYNEEKAIFRKALK